MKVLLINKYHYVRGGSDSVYFNTSHLLKDNGHEVIHFAMDYPENKPSDQSAFFAQNKDFVVQPFYQKVKNASSFFYNKDAASKLAALLKEEKPDIAHLHIFYGSLTSSILKILKDFNVPAVVSVHDYKFVCPAYLFLNGNNIVCEECEGRHYFNAVKNKCVKGSYLFSTMFAMEAYYRDKFFPLEEMFSKMIFVSKFAKEIHIKYKPNLSRIATHLYNFDPVLNTKLPNSEKGGYFLYAGRLSKEKGLTTLVNAANDLYNIQFKIAGTGPEADRLRILAGNNVEFLGFQKGEALQQLIANASFVIVPSEWYENNPMAIIEAYSLGKPVIAARIGGIPEIVQEGLTGFLHEPGDTSSLLESIEKACALNEEEYIGMSTAAFDFAQRNFAPRSHYNQLIEIYSNVLNDL